MTAAVVVAEAIVQGAAGAAAMALGETVEAIAAVVVVAGTGTIRAQAGQKSRTMTDQSSRQLPKKPSAGR